MKKLIVTSLIGLAILIACNSTRSKTLLLQKPADIPADEYVINTGKDTVLTTKNGAQLYIPKGALQSIESSVTLEIKEAYSLEQMLRAGLTTQSNGELLSSGGMIYINAKGGQEVKIKQGIKVSIPSDYLDSEMQLYKGEESGNGGINWINPTPLSDNKTFTEIEKGKQLFMSNCASCHKIGAELTGPNLAHFLKRFTGEKLWLRGHTIHIPRMIESNSDTNKYEKYEWLSDRSELWHNQELYFCNLLSIYHSVGPQFQNLDTAGLNSIYRYIQNESDKNDLPLPAISYLDSCVDSCMFYNKNIHLYKERKQDAVNKQKTLVDENGNLVEETSNNFNPGMQTNQDTTNPPVADTNKVEPKQYGSVYYQFTIETFGWFNIDVLLKGKDGVEESELFVRVIGQYQEKVQVYLIVPSVKINAQGGPAERNASEYAFQYKDGKVLLPQKIPAYILAVTETESSIAFALHRFTTGRKQEFSISLRSASKEEFNQAVKMISADGMNISARDSKNADEIRKTNQEIKDIDSILKRTELLKPKNCDCNCFDNIGNTPKPVASNER